MFCLQENARGPLKVSWKTLVGNQSFPSAWGIFVPIPTDTQINFCCCVYKEEQTSTLLTKSRETLHYYVRFSYTNGLSWNFGTKLGSRRSTTLVCDRSPVLTSGRETATRLPTRPAKPSQAARLASLTRQRSRCRPQGQRLRLWVCVDLWFCLDRRKEENEDHFASKTNSSVHRERALHLCTLRHRALFYCCSSSCLSY